MSTSTPPLGRFASCTTATASCSVAMVKIGRNSSTTVTPAGAARSQSSPKRSTTAAWDGGTAGHEDVAHAQLARGVDQRVARIDVAAEDHRLHVERGQAGGVQASGHLAGRRVGPRVGVEPQPDAAVAGPGGDGHRLGRADVEHRAGGQRDEPLSPVVLRPRQPPMVRAESQNGARRARLLTLPIVVRPTVSTMSTERGHL